MKAGFRAADEWLGGVERQFTDHGIEVAIDLGGVLAGVDLEVTEVAALAAERDVDVDAQRRAGPRRAVQGLVRLRHLVLVPERIGRVVGDEIIARGGLFTHTYVCPLAHREPLFGFPSRSWRIFRLLSIEYIRGGGGGSAAEGFCDAIARERGGLFVRGKCLESIGCGGCREFCDAIGLGERRR